VTNFTLAQSYLLKARIRLKILQVLLDENAYSDVVREAQEIVELSLKGMLRQVGVEPPKWHDVTECTGKRRTVLGALSGALPDSCYCCLLPNSCRGFTSSSSWVR
jgi:HEPN domain